MKKVICSILVLLLLSGCTFNLNGTPKEAEIKQPVIPSYFVKSVWITYYELEDMINKKNEAEFTSTAEDAMKTLFDMGFNTVTVQVRPFSDAFYCSDYFPSSKYCFGKQGSDMPYDPFEIICKAAEKNNLRVEAWINPYRISNNSNIDELSDENPAKIWMSNSKKKRNVYITKNGIYYNPARKDVTDLIVNGAVEIIKKYNVASIHFDDYFYPTVSKKIDNREYVKYCKKGGKFSLEDWRRENVSNMLKSVYKAVKEADSNVLFGVSPAADIERDKNELFADVEKWAKEKGYADYICPQVYFGFKNAYKPFMFTVKKWLYITERKLFIGLPLYKAGRKDKYAALDDKEAVNEFKNNSNILERQVNYIAKTDGISGIYIFSYSSLFDKKAKAETENMLKALQSINR